MEINLLQFWIIVAYNVESKSYYVNNLDEQFKATIVRSSKDDFLIQRNIRC